jgi:hypothetical protein
VSVQSQASAPTVLDRLLDLREQLRPRLIAGLGFAWLALLVLFYWYTGPNQEGTDSHGLLARAFLDGRLFIIGDHSSLELVPRGAGTWYSPFPPLPAVTFMPFVAAGMTIDTNLPSAVVGAIAVGLMWLLLDFLETRERLIMTAGFALGSEFLWVAATGGQHLYPQVLATALVLGAIYVARRKGPPLLAGILTGLAFAARIPTALAVPFIAWITRRPIPVLVGAALAALPVLLYNAARFGSPFEFGYGLIRNVYGESVLAEPWYSAGILSIDYLPRGLYTMFLRSFDFVEEAPWFRPSWAGASVLLTMPVLAWIPTVRGRDAAIGLAAAVLIMIPNLLHGAPGFTQFGYRFIVDALPILWLLLAEQFRDGIPRGAAAAIVLGIWVNLYGLWAIWSIHFVG